MSYSIAFRFRNREYYSELTNTTALSFGCHKKDSIQIPDSREHLLTLQVKDGRISVTMQQPLVPPANGQIPLNESISLSEKEGAYLYISVVTGRSPRSVNLPYNGQVTCGRADTNDIVIPFKYISGHHFRLLCEAGQVHVEDLNSTNHLYLNGRQVTKALVKSGDVLSVFTVRFLLKNGVLYFENVGEGLRILTDFSKAHKIPEAKPVQAQPGKKEPGKKTSKYLQYHLSPRIREQLPHEPIVLSGAPGQGHLPGGRRGNLLYLISSGAMMAASLATGGITPAALLTRAAGMLSPIASMAMFSKMGKEEKKQFEEYEQMRQERYQAYIADQKARIAKVADVQRRIVTNENRKPEQCIATVQELKRNLWERQPSDSDFLVTRLGIGQARLCVEVKSRADTDGFHMVDDELDELAGQIIEETRYVENIPVCVPLRSYQTVGIVGPGDRQVYQMRNILVELTTQHSYRDVRLVLFYDKEYGANWEMLRWLPHVWDETGQTRYLAYDESRRHTVCELLGEMVRHRKLDAQAEGRKKEQMVLPHYIIIAQRREFLQSEAIYEDLISNNPSLGVTTIFLAEEMYDLPQSCQYLVELKDKPYAYERDKYDERAYYTPDETLHRPQMDAFARRLAAIELESREKSAAIPTAVTFLQGYRVNTVEELDIRKRWEESEPYRTLAAPIGVMEGGKVFSLDVRSGEQSHGPHGLLAGTTGSGKSELLQTWILSMAVNYHPHDVNFVIIDYKGGGMSDLMEPLPHVVGKITNIDRNISRSLVSLKSELKRRQELFARCGVNNIDKYQRAWQNGEVKERLPHLIIVTDEFAEMKKEEPEFMTELNSVATVGRSLGIHMLLATQKPAGVVTDQINSNSRFRICMKVQDVADSREMLKRSDAARITQSGRAYIRVGEDELFELFQSFYSAAEYTGSHSGGMKAENQVRVVGVVGDRVGAVKKQKKNSGGVDELTAIVRHMNEICRAQGIEKLPGPWLPELTKWLTFAELDAAPGFDGTAWPANRRGLKIPIGKYDVPALQRQGTQYLDFMAVGHYGVFGSPASGKTTLLKTVLTALAMYYTPQEVQVTAVDAGNWSLSEFSGLPHVRGVILNQEEEKIHGLVVRMQKELEVRKHAFLSHAVNSLSAYREAVSGDLPAIVLMVDHLGPLFEQYMDFTELMMEIAASGAAYGIYLIFTANSSLGLSYKFLQLIKGTIALQMTDKGDYASLVGPIAGISLPNVPGRALMKGNPPVAFQTVVYADAQEDQKRHEAVLQMAEQMKQVWDMQKRELQEEIGKAAAEEKEDSGEKLKQEYHERGSLPIGVNSGTLETVWLDLTEPYVLLISSDSAEKNRDVLAKLREKLAVREDNQILRLNQENAQEQMKDLGEILDKRKKSYLQHKKDTDFDAHRWLEAYKQICLFIEDLPAFAQGLSEDGLKAYRRIFTKAGGLGVTILAAGMREQLSASETDLLTNAAILAGNTLAFGGSPFDHRFAQCEADPARLGTPLDEDEAALIKQGKLTVLRFL